MESNNLKFFRGKRRISKEDIYFYNEFRKMCISSRCWEKEEFYEFGYETFGVILLGFCIWLHNYVIDMDLEKIFFFSRDGYILKESYELLFGKREVPTDYLYVSRRSLRVPHLLLCQNRVDRVGAICPTKYISVQDLLESIGIDDDREVTSILHKYGINKRDVLKDEELNENNKYTSFLDEIWDNVIANASEEYVYLMKYLKEKELIGNIAVVDIGWRASMQKFLTELLHNEGINCRLNGFYLTLNSSMQRKINIKGYLGEVNEKSKGCDLLRGYVGLIETLFLKTEGSTKKYTIINGKTVPILYPYEYEECGDYTYEAKSVLSIQKGALDFLKDYKENMKIQKTLFSAKTAFANLDEFANRPNLSDVEMFGNFKFYNGSISELANPRSLVQYIKNPISLKQDFYGSRWRIGFFKRLFKMPLNYERLFKVFFGLISK